MTNARSTADAASEGELFRLLVENAQDYAIFVVDPQGLVQSWNAGAERLLGYREVEILGRSADLFFTPEDLQRGVPRQEREAALGSSGGSDDRWHVRKDGSRFWSGGMMTPLWDDGRLRGFAKTMRDRTGWKQAEDERADRAKEAERQQRLYDAALSTTPDFVYVFDLQHRFIYANPGLLKMWGRTWDDAIGKTCLELGYEPWHAAMHSREIDQVVATKQPLKGEVPFTGTYGRRIYEYIFNPVLGDDDEVEAVAGTTRDVTERNQTEQALRESVRLYKAIGESIDYGVWVCDPEGRNTYCSESFLRLVGLTQEECSSFGWKRVLHPDDADRTISAWQECVRTGENWDIEHRFRGVDGRWHPILARGVPVRNERNEITAWAGINLNISRLKQVEDELREADRRKDEFLATLAHELRNPLAPIRNSLQILKMARIDEETIQQTRDMMDRQVHHLVRLVDDLLDVSRVMRGKIELRKERIELATIVARAVETVQPLIEVQGHRLELALSPESLLLDADPVRLAQVVGNLLTNAAKYTEANGRIRLSAERERDGAVLKIRDNGIGIAANMLPRIFELFVQVDHAATRSQGGLGIGLTLVKNLVEMHGGSVEAQSDGLGHGSEFVVHLPLIAQPMRTTEEPLGREVDPKPVSSGNRLLVVDDNRDAALSLAMLLRLQGHDVRVAHDGRSAIETAAAYLPDMVFLDLGMPEMDGYEVARRLRKLAGLEKTWLTALTGWGQQEDRRRTTAVGFDHHLVKPLEAKTLEQLLAQLKQSKSSQG